MAVMPFEAALAFVQISAMPRFCLHLLSSQYHSSFKDAAAFTLCL